MSTFFRIYSNFLKKNYFST